MRRDENGWSISLGTWANVSVRVHILTFIFGAVTLFFGWKQSTPTDGSSLVWIAAVSLIVLAMSVLWHEAGHFLAVVRFGGQMSSTVLWPLGGLIPPAEPHDSTRAVAIHLAGPAANLAACLGMTPLLLGFGVSPLEVVALLNPLAPAALTSGVGSLILLKLVFWVNWVLAIVNLIPAYPFDGGRALRAAISGMWREHGRLRAELVITRAALISGLVLFAAAWFARNVEGGLLPVWFALVLLGIFLIFSAQRELQAPTSPEPENDDRLFGYDFSEGYTSLERSSNFDEDDTGPIAHWVEQRRLHRQEQQQQAEAEDDRRMDEILDRVHHLGLGSLTSEEREVLNRVSARYRNRTPKH